ncbi:hypothetical protein PMAYCL1PPCAC_29660, partial [Pristionchus mayeri]
ARCGVSRIYFDIGCHRNQYFSPFESCESAAIGVDYINCQNNHKMSILLKTLPMAQEISNVTCDGESWKVYDVEGELIKSNNGIIREQDSPVYIRCLFYKQPTPQDYTVIFVWFGFIIFIVSVAIYRCLSAYKLIETFYFWRKDTVSSSIHLIIFHLKPFVYSLHFRFIRHHYIRKEPPSLRVISL